MNSASPYEALVVELNGRKRKGGLSQTAMACEAGVSQSTMCRVLKGKVRAKDSDALKKLFIYAGLEPPLNVQKREVDPRESPDLMAALEEAWNGTKPHAKKLAKVIRTLGFL